MGWSAPSIVYQVDWLLRHMTPYSVAHALWVSCNSNMKLGIWVGVW